MRRPLDSMEISMNGKIGWNTRTKISTSAALSGKILTHLPHGACKISSIPTAQGQVHLDSPLSNVEPMLNSLGNLCHHSSLILGHKRITLPFPLRCMKSLFA